MQSDETSTRSNLFKGLIVLLAIIIGILQVTQNGINIALTNWTQFPLRSAFFNFFVGALTLLPLFIFCKPNIDGDTTSSLGILFENLCISLKEDKKNCIVFLNGPCGIIWICTAIYIAPQIGFGLYAICTVIGQIMFSMIIDHFGLIWNEKKKLSRFNMFGSIIAISGVIIFQIPAIAKTAKNDSKINPFLLLIYIILSIFAGVSYTLLSALNRRLKIIMKSTPYQPAFLLFSNATIILLILNFILYFIINNNLNFKHQDLKWYMFFGGMLGAFIVSMYIICLLNIGFVTTYICSIFGALFISLIYDIIGAFGVDIYSKGNHIAILWKIGGVLCVLIGAIIMNVKRNIDTNDDFGIVSTTEIELEMEECPQQQTLEQ